MTETHRRLLRLGGPHRRARLVAGVLLATGAALAAAAAGVAMAPRPGAVIGAWVLVAASVAAGGWAVVRARRSLPAGRIGALVEAVLGARAGSVSGAALGAARGAGTSTALFAAADARAAALVLAGGPAAARSLRRTTLRLLGAGAGTAALGAVLLAAAGPRRAGAAAFWHPVRALRDARAPVRIGVDRPAVRRGDSVHVTVAVPGATGATLWTRGPGEPWRPVPVDLDAAGRGSRTLGPLETDLFLRATAGGGRRRSAELHVTVLLPLFVSALELTAQFPEYLARPDEPVEPGPAPLALPVGTRVVVRGEASAPLAAAGWRRAGDGVVTPLRVRDRSFAGTLAPALSGTWTLALQPVDSATAAEPPPLVIQLVPDSAPSVSVPIPGRDTTAPLSLRQPLVIDARDDHGLTAVTVVSWRVSQTGRIDAPVRAATPTAGDRVIVQGELDLERRGLLPGDTLRFYVEATDNAPGPHVTRSPEFALRLPSRAELRAATREAAQALARSADSVAAAQGALADQARDAAAERMREPATPGAPPGAQRGALPFRASERAAEIARQQEALAAQAQQLAGDVEELAQAVEAAGLADSAFVAKLEEVQRLLDRAVSPELAQRLRDLQDALRRLDPEATRMALQRLAELQRQMRDELERSGELFRRAATEGTLSTLAQDAEELARRQEDWVRGDALRADSAAAAAERALARRADSLAAALADAERSLGDSVAAPSAGDALRRPQGNLTQARGAMRSAARQAEAGDAPGAQQAGQEAAGALDALADALRAGRDSLADAWRAEALAALDRAMAETAALAQRQEAVGDALRRGETGAETRALQGSVEEGAEAIAGQIREAAGRHALVSPQLDAALGFAQRQMRGARQQLEQPDPNGTAARALADEALDALNATAHALARTRGAVAGSSSGSGFREAVEQMARLAEQQQGLTGDAQGLLPMVGQGGAGVLQQLRALAARQRALAEQLEALRAAGGAPGAGPLADEARELARQLDAGRLDQRTVERQERLFRRLLDAGRTLTGDEPDPDKERTSRSARGDSVHRPSPLAPGATGTGPRVRYPTWEELRGLTAEERRLVLEYFRRLNAPVPEP